MMFFPLFLIAFSSLVKSQSPTSNQPISIPQPVYKPSESPAFVPHATYPFSDSFNSALDGYIVPALPFDFSLSENESKNSIVSIGQVMLQTALRLFVKVGLFLVGAIVLVFVGAIFHSFICSFSQLCTVNYHGFGTISNETVRALVTPERVARAAVFLQDAMEKYKNMQEEVAKN